MNYAEIKYPDIANGPGVRVSLFVSGCHFHCKGCFNEVAWDFNFGEPFTDDVIQRILNMLSPEYIAGLTILGGEPLAKENRETVANLVRTVKKTYSNKTIWVYTGYLFEDLLGIYWTDHDIRQVMDCIDVLVDGQFLENQKNISLRFRGSDNQRIIDVPASYDAHAIVPWVDWQDTEGMKTVCTARNAAERQK